MNKRRVSAARAEERRHQNVVRHDRRRRLILGGVVGFLAVALIVPLAAGLILAGSDTEPDPSDELLASVPTSTVPLSLVDPQFAGASVVGETPCPATDGTQVRTTEFETPPPLCINADSTYEATLIVGEELGDITITIDPASALEATNLFVAFADYGVYDQAAVTWISPGLTVIGGDGDAGFTIDSTEPPVDGIYPIGSVVMLTRIDGSLEGQLVMVTSEEAAESLTESPVHPLIGTITEGLDAAQALHDTAFDDLLGVQRISAISVTESSVTG